MFNSLSFNDDLISRYEISNNETSQQKILTTINCVTLKAWMIKVHMQIELSHIISLKKNRKNTGQSYFIDMPKCSQIQDNYL